MPLISLISFPEFSQDFSPLVSCAWRVSVGFKASAVFSSHFLTSLPSLSPFQFWQTQEMNTTKPIIKYEKGQTVLLTFCLGFVDRLTGSGTVFLRGLNPLLCELLTSFVNKLDHFNRRGWAFQCESPRSVPGRVLEMMKCLGQNEPDLGSSFASARCLFQGLGHGSPVARSEKESQPLTFPGLDAASPPRPFSVFGRWCFHLFIFFLSKGDHLKQHQSSLFQVLSPEKKVKGWDRDNRIT